MSKNYICTGKDTSYGTTVVGEGDTLSEAYEDYKESCDLFGGNANDAEYCKFYPFHAVAALALEVEIKTSVVCITEKKPVTRRKK